jgi:hypothetical protein
MERLLELPNELGLLSEEIDLADGSFLGNFPQAFSHSGLINAAVAIAHAEGGRREGGPPGSGQPGNGHAGKGHAGKGQSGGSRC